MIRWTFRTAAEDVPVKEIATIEHLVRKGKKSVEMWENPGVKDVTVSQQMRNWEVGRRWRW